MAELYRMNMLLLDAYNMPAGASNGSAASVNATVFGRKSETSQSGKVPRYSVGRPWLEWRKMWRWWRVYAAGLRSAG
jgi:hypothetical protein